MLKSILRGTGIGLLVGGMIGTAMAGFVGGAIGAVIGLLVGAVIMMGMALGGAMSGKYPRVTNRVEFDCPHSNRHVEAVLLKNTDTNEVFEVCECSRFQPAKDVTCKKRCLDDVNQGAVQITTPAPHA